MKPTIKSWRDGVHPEETERRIAWLEKQVAAAEDAISAQREIIEHDGMNFAYRLSLNSLEASRNSHVSELAELMKQREMETLHFALDGDAYSKHRAPASVLAEFIGNVQQLFLRIAQGVETGKFRRNIDHQLKRMCQLEVAAFYPSSFGVQFVAPTNTDLAGQSITVLAMERTMALVTAEQPLEELAVIGPYALVQYRRLIKTLIDAQARPKVDWKSPAGKEITWTADHNRLLTLANRLAKIRNEKPALREARGTLVGVSQRRQKFEFASQGRVLTGHAPRELMPKLKPYFTESCIAVFTETTYIDESTEQEKVARTLIDIKPA